MKFGYMSGFRGDLISEIKFAKEYFDFTEITIQPNLLEEIDSMLGDLKLVTNDFEVVGHIHWEIIDFDKIIKNIKVLKELGVKKITIHPFEKLNIEENAQIFNKINSFLQKNNLQLLIENVSATPYNSEKVISELLKKIPGAKITLDIGHANRILEVDEFINKLGPKIGHIHLHDNIGDLDHLFYINKEKLDGIISKIKSFGYDDTVLLETFSIMLDGKNTSQEWPAIKDLHIKQLELIKNCI